MQPGRQILSLDEIKTKEDIGKSAVLGAEGSVVVQVRVPLTEKKKVSAIHTDHTSCSYFHFGERTWKSWALWPVIYSVWLRRRYAIAFLICWKLHNFLRLSARFSVSDRNLARAVQEPR